MIHATHIDQRSGCSLPSTEDIQRIHNSRIELLSANYWYCDPSWDMGERLSIDEFLFIPINGRISIKTEGTEHILQAGQCLFLSNGMRCQIGFAEGCRYLEVVAVHCHIHDQNGLRFLDNLNQCCYDISQLSSDDFCHLSSLYHRDKASADAYAKTLIRQLLSSWLFQGMTFKSPLQSDLRIAKALDIIHQHFYADLSVQSLANEVGLGVVQFRNLFKQETQQSPKSYIAQYRLHQAAMRLRNSNTAIKSIATDIGFQNEQYFHNSFKKHYGCTPSTFRKQIMLEI